MEDWGISILTDSSFPIKGSGHFKWKFNIVLTVVCCALSLACLGGSLNPRGWCCWRLAVVLETASSLCWRTTSTSLFMPVTSHRGLLNLSRFGAFIMSNSAVLGDQICSDRTSVAFLKCRSKESIWLLSPVKQKNPLYTPERCCAFQCDLTKDDLREHVPEGSVDVITLIFVLSAVHPDKMKLVLQNISRVRTARHVIASFVWKAQIFIHTSVFPWCV